LNSYNHPVIVGLSGGLGNQIFQYAAGLSLASRLQVPLVLDLSWFGGQKDRKFALSPFNIEASQQNVCEWMSPTYQALVSRLSRRWFSKIMGVPVWHEPHFHYTKNFGLIEKSVFLEGYWQSELYFREHRSLLLQQLSLRGSMPLDCRNLLDEILESDAICVHVRRGDYLSNPLAAKIYEPCSIEYYKKGVSEISETLRNPRCFIFSDDPTWVTSSLSLDCPMKVVDVNGPENAHFDLILMAACKHFLIANSSLSWWGAWLGIHPNKRVIAPKRWFLTPDRDTRDLLPSSWEKL